MSHTDPVLGRTVAQEDFPGLQLLTLAHEPDTILFVGDELQAKCPVTRQPDFYEWSVELTAPGGYTIESKSLAMYMRTFANRQIAAEDLCCEIRDDVVEAFNRPEADAVVVGSVEVAVNQKSRGGISIRAKASWALSS